MSPNDIRLYWYSSFPGIIERSLWFAILAQRNLMISFIKIQYSAELSHSRIFGMNGMGCASFFDTSFIFLKSMHNR